ncbi:MAG: metal-sensitive transcriptional regulator [bacterium]|nr:metal-sensitive transcriptional regulator [bacterium]
MDKTAKQEALQRLAIAEGHLKRVQQMVEDEAYCPDIIHQSRAVQSALKKVDEIILHGHLHTCVLEDIHGPRAKNEKLVQEILDLFKKNGQ